MTDNYYVIKKIENLEKLHAYIEKWLVERLNLLERSAVDASAQHKAQLADAMREQFKELHRYFAGTAKPFVYAAQTESFPGNKGKSDQVVDSDMARRVAELEQRANYNKSVLDNYRFAISKQDENIGRLAKQAGELQARIEVQSDTITRIRGQANAYFNMFKESHSRQEAQTSHVVQQARQTAVLMDRADGHAEIIDDLRKRLAVLEQVPVKARKPKGKLNRRVGNGPARS